MPLLEDDYRAYPDPIDEEQLEANRAVRKRLARSMRKAKPKRGPGCPAGVRKVSCVCGSTFKPNSPAYRVHKKVFPGLCRRRAYP